MGPQLMRQLLSAVQQAQNSNVEPEAELAWLMTLLQMASTPTHASNTETPVRLQYQGGFETEDACLLDSSALQLILNKAGDSAAAASTAVALCQLWLDAVHRALNDGGFSNSLARTHNGMLLHVASHLDMLPHTAASPQQVFGAVMKLVPGAVPDVAAPVSAALISNLPAVLAVQLPFSDIASWVTCMVECDHKQHANDAGVAVPTAAGVESADLLQRYMLQLVASAEAHSTGAAVHMSAVCQVLSNNTPSAVAAVHKLQAGCVSAITQLVSSSAPGLAQQAAKLAQQLASHPQMSPGDVSVAATTHAARHANTNAASTPSSSSSSTGTRNDACVSTIKLFTATQQLRVADATTAAYGAATAADFQKAKVRVVQLQAQLLGQVPLPAARQNKGHQGVRSEGQLVLTATTLHNIERVEQALLAQEDAAAPLLLEGATGVGKTATVQHVADKHDLKLIRFNMSASITVEDLCGRAMLSSNGGMPGFQMQMGPFCKAFQEGVPLLLDELNLASDEVLRCIETALDTGVVQMHTTACADQASITIERAAGFRLLATQNPSAGAYRGLRERLSPALLARFTIFALQELPAGEWKQVVEVKLKQHGVDAVMAAELADQLVDVHLDVQKATTTSDFPEVGKSYAELTIRELLRWTDITAAQLNCTCASPVSNTVLDSAVLGASAVSTYAARYRSQAARNRIIQAISSSLCQPPAALTQHNAQWGKGITWQLVQTEDTTDAGGPQPASQPDLLPSGQIPEHSGSDFEGNMAAPTVSADSSIPNMTHVRLGVAGCSVQRPVPSFDAIRQRLRARELDDNGTKFTDEMIAAAIAAHLRAVSTIHSPEFIKQHGLYQCDHVLLMDWLERVAAEKIPPDTSIMLLYGYWVYASTLRHQAARQQLAPAFEISMERGIRCQMQNLQAFMMLTRTPPPASLTKGMLEVVQHAMPALQSGTPLLITGSAGCGKAAALETCAMLLQLPTTRYQLTAETEPSDLVGEYAPVPPVDNNDNDSDRIAWVDGVATRAVKQGGALVLSHLETADAKVVERLNPLLEQPPSWTLTERGDTAQCTAAGAAAGTDAIGAAATGAAGLVTPLQVMATLTPPARHEAGVVASHSNELSPALANRFSCVHMHDVLEASDVEFQHEMQHVAATLLSDSAGVDPTLAAKVCVTIRNTVAGIKAGTIPAMVTGSSSSSTMPAVSSTNRDGMVLTLRTFVRLLDTCYHISLQKYAQAFSFKECLAAAFQYAVLPQLGASGPKVAAEVHKLLRLQHAVTVEHDILKQQRIGSHVLTPSRVDIATALLTCLDCNLPVLLEGPAAVGKTSLVEALAGAVDIPLLRVNNSLGTTAADYFGMYVPDGQGGFTWQAGPLLVAVKDGSWLLIDELNLAPASVLSLLGPLLDGATTISIPGQGEQEVDVHPCFRLVATCNPDGYAGRHALPLSLRSRLQVIAVDDFPQDELAIILHQRFQGSEFSLEPADALQLATLYHACQQADSAASAVHSGSLALTLHDLIKAARRAGIFKCSLQDALLSLLAVRHPPASAAADTVLQAIRTTWSHAAWLSASGYKVKADEDGVLVSAVRVRYVLNGASLHRSPLWTLGAEGQALSAPPASFIRDFVHMVLALAAGEPVLLEGPPCYKTTLATTYCQLLGCEDQLISVHLNEGSDVADLPGQLRPYTFEDLLQLLPSLVQDCLDRWELVYDSADDPQIAMLQASHMKPLRAEQGMLEQHIQLFMQCLHHHKQQQQDDARQAQAARNHERILAAMADTAARQEAAAPGPMQGRADAITSSIHLRHSQQRPGVALSTDSLKSWDDEDASAVEGSDWEEVNAFTRSHADSAVASIEDGAGSSSTEVYSMLGVQYDSMRKEEPAALQMGAGHQLQEDLPLPQDLHDSMAYVLCQLQRLQEPTPAALPDMSLTHLLARLEHAWHYVSAEHAQHAGPLFAFKDGPVVTAARQGLPLLLENIADPPPSVTERLNSLLDTEPSLVVVEDPMAGSKSQREVPAASSIIATAHASISQHAAKQQISPAARSRFTVLHVAGYTNAQLQQVVQHVISRGGVHTEKTPGQLASRLWSLHEVVQSDARWRVHGALYIKPG